MDNRVCPNPDCGRSVSADAKTCKYCGAVIVKDTPKKASRKSDDLGLPLVCPECGGTIKAGQTLCPKCGYERPAAKAASKPTAASKKAAPKKAQHKPPPEPKTDTSAKPPRTKVIIPSKTKITPPPVEAKSSEQPEPEKVPSDNKPESKAPAAKTKAEEAPVAVKKPEPGKLAVEGGKIEHNPQPPTRREQKAIDSRESDESKKKLPPPPGLDDGYLPERPDQLPDNGIHVFLRGLQWAAKPMDYPTLIKNMRSHKIGPADFVYAGGEWRTVAEVFNLPEVE